MPTLANPLPKTSQTMSTPTNTIDVATKELKAASASFTDSVAVVKAAKNQIITANDRVKSAHMQRKATLKRHASAIKQMQLSRAALAAAADAVIAARRAAEKEEQP